MEFERFRDVMISDGTIVRLYEFLLDKFDTTKPYIVEILIYAALLSLVVGRELLSLVIEHAKDDAVFPPERWAAIL